MLRNEHLCNLITQYLNSTNQNIYNFEKHVGVSNGSIHRIFSDINKFPSLETLIKVSEYLNITVDELIGRHSLKEKPSLVIVPYESFLFRQICLYIMYFIDKHQVKNLNLNDIIISIQHIYHISIVSDKNFQNIDNADWYLKNNLLDKKN